MKVFGVNELTNLWNLLGMIKRIDTLPQNNMIQLLIKL
jgi:hypothetical protein